MKGLRRSFASVPARPALNSLIDLPGTFWRFGWRRRWRQSVRRRRLRLKPRQSRSPPTASFWECGRRKKLRSSEMHLARQASERSLQARSFFMAGTPAKTAAYPACAPSASARYRKLGKSLRKRISLRRCPTSHIGVAACRQRPEQLELLLGGFPGRLAGARFLAFS